MSGPVYTNKFVKNAIYFFRYKSELAKEDKISVYDQAPIVIFLYFGANLALGVNIHWIPRQFRDTFLDIVLQQSEIPTKRGFKYKIDLSYPGLKGSLLGGYAYSAIRRYFYKNISNLQVIPPEMYDKILGTKRLRSRFAYRARNYKH